jgi:hypothetical protein
MPEKKSTAMGASISSASQNIIKSPDAITLPKKIPRIIKRLDPKLYSNVSSLKSKYDSIQMQKLRLQKRIDILEEKLRETGGIPNILTLNDVKYNLFLTLLFSIVLITSSDDPSALERKEDPLKSPQSDISRPSSAPTVGSKSSPKPPRISSSEQADIDRYVERQLGLRKKEKDDLLQMKLYEQELRERKTTSCAPCILHLCDTSFSLGTIRAPS